MSDGFPAHGPEKCIQVHFEQPGKEFQSHNSLFGRRLKGKERNGSFRRALAFLSRLKLPFPSFSNACHAG